MLGLVVLVPLIEELFWRSFLIRWLVDPDFQKVPIGRVTLMAAAVTSVMFALVHPEWLPAFSRGRSGHGCCGGPSRSPPAWSATLRPISRWAIYVIATGDWKYW